MYVICRERILREFRANSPLRNYFSKKKTIASDPSLKIGDMEHLASLQWGKKWTGRKRMGIWLKVDK
jgi:hypothetical protein